MENVHRRGKAGTYYVKKDIPKDVQAAFGGKAQVWRSLRTTDKREAAKRAVAVLDELTAQIDKARGRGSFQPITPPKPLGRINPDRAYEAIERWGQAATQEAYEDHFSGLAGAIDPIGDDAVERSRLIHALQERRYSGVKGFNKRLIEALASQGLVLAPDHPVLTRLAPWFATAWSKLEAHVARFQAGDFSQWPEDDEESDVAAVAEGAEATEKPVKLHELLESYVASARPPDEQLLRGYVRRLKEHLSDPALSDITTLKLDHFLTQLRQFPKTKRPDIHEMSFDRIISQFGADPDLPRLSPKTVWKWAAAYNRLFDYAVRMKLLKANPMAGAMPRLKDGDRGERLAYDNDDIAAIFSTPMFRGCAGAVNQKGDAWGYRIKPGPYVLKDAYYWLPLFCLWHGCRIEEVGAAKTADFKTDGDDIWHLDLTARKLKTRQSQRLLPLHPKIIELGFLDYIEEQVRAGSEYIFPDLPHDPSGRLAATRLFTKWWGHWCRENAVNAGAGFDHPHKTFHSFRHSFKRACRDAGVPEEVHDLLTGHKSQSVGRGYGQGASLQTLTHAIEQVRYRSFPALS